MTIGAFALKVTVGKIAIALRAICRGHGVFEYAIVIPEGKKDIVNHLGVVRGVGSGEKIEGNAQLLPGFQESLVVPGCHLLRTDSLPFGADGYGCAVHIAAGDHQDVVALQAMVAGEDVGGEISPGDMPQMQWPIGIRPGNSNKNMLGHNKCILAQICHGCEFRVVGLRDEPDDVIKYSGSSLTQSCAVEVRSDLDYRG
ncbi:MAG: hypothetical protein DDT28_01045 [Dehalococcoidia bacterium]|nr:hypothetical protein [Chloroflexota bacterium]